MPRKKSRAHSVLLLMAWLLPVVLVAMRSLTSPVPSGFGTHEQLGLAPCRFRELLGFRCPGCGVTTSVSHFAHGALLESLRVQPLGFVLAVLALALPLVATQRVLVGADLGEEARVLLRAPFVITMGAVVLASWAYKLFIG